MDAIDRRIVALLQEDGRAPHASLAREVGLSVSAVNDRVRRLADRGVITGYGARIDPEAVGVDVLAFVSVAIDWRRRDEGFVQGVCAMPEVLECHQVTGDWTYLLKIRAASNDALEDLLSNRIKLLPGVTRSETVFTLRSMKETMSLPIGGQSADEGGRSPSA